MEIYGMLQDPRRIKSIELPGAEQAHWTVGEGVGGIRVYGEPGQGIRVPWFAILANGKIVQRVNAAMVEVVVYEEEK